MHRALRNLLAVALAAAIPAVVSAATTPLNVHIRLADGSGVAGVTVVAVDWGMNGPSTYTLMGVTDSSGNYVFNLENNGGAGKNYTLYFTKHGVTPTISAQFNDPEGGSDRWVWVNEASQPRYSTFTVKAGLARVGRITQEFVNASTGAVLFGGVWNMKTQTQGGTGIVLTSVVSGSGTLAVDNVPFAAADTYNIGLYDPQLNKGIGRNVMRVLGSSSPVVDGAYTEAYTGAFTLDFANAFQGGSDGGAKSDDGTTASAAGVEGIVVSTSGAFIPWMGLEFKSCRNGMNWQTWTHVGKDGRFQLFDLTPGVTYYVRAMGGCAHYEDTHASKCFEPFSTPNFDLQETCGAVGRSANDVVYTSTLNTVYHKVVLNEMPKSSGQIPVYVRTASGIRLPNAGVSITSDGSPWPADAQSCSNPNNYNMFFSTNFAYAPGFSNAQVQTSATGYALLDGLPSGNYTINVWTPFSSGYNPPWNDTDRDGFAFGDNGCNQGCNWSAAHCQSKGSDDYRITVTTWTTPVFKVYDSSGAEVGLSSITYVVEAGGFNMNGLVRGTVSFPGVVDLTANPILITLSPQCNQGPCGAFGNFAAIASSGAAQYSYEIAVSTGYSYWMQVKAAGWGRVRTDKGGEESNVSLTSTGTVVLGNMSFEPAGTVKGTLFKPGGTEPFIPSDNQHLGVCLDGDKGHSHDDVAKDGTFEVTDALPGVSRLFINGGGSDFNYTVPSPQPTVNVTAGETVTANLTLVNAVLVGASLDLSKVPDASVIQSGHDQILGFRVVPVKAGTVLTGAAVKEMLFGGDGDNRIRYSPATGPGEEGPCGMNWPGGFCAARVASPSVYDVYLMRSGDFGDMSSTATVANRPYPHFTMLTSSKSVIVDPARANALVRTAYSQFQSSGVLVNLTPETDLSARGNAVVAGTVTAANFFRQADYDALGGDFEKFLEYLVMVSLYDANGAFRAAGIVVPPIDWIKAHEDEMDLAFAQGYEQFKAAFANVAMQFEIRGLAPSTCFTALATTPNYPPYQTKVCTGVNGSTTTISVNLDSAVGAGATVKGVVTSTNTAVRLSNVKVLLVSESETRTAVTDSTGAYKFEGLAEGLVKLKVSADGYAQQGAENNLVGSNIYTQNFALSAAPGTISGTVYSKYTLFSKTPYEKGATILAYDDTYNGLNPDKPVPLIKTVTDAEGKYKLTGLVPGDVYKIFLKVPGYYALSVATPAVSGDITVDFIMKPKPKDLEIFARKTAKAYEFKVLNVQDFDESSFRYSVKPYSEADSLLLGLDKLSTGEYGGKVPLAMMTPGITYVLHASASYYLNSEYVNVVRELEFSKEILGNADQKIDSALLGDEDTNDQNRKYNEVPLDRDGDNKSALRFPPGSAQSISTGAVPSLSFRGEDRNSPGLSGKVGALGGLSKLLSDIYTLSLSSVTLNNGKWLELVLAYDTSDLGDLDELEIVRYNSSTGQWDSIGLVKPDKANGTVLVKLTSLTSVSAFHASAATAQFNGKQYVLPLAGSGGGSGTFAVVKPAAAGGAYGGSKVKVFNVPNPFNLKSKTVTPRAAATGVGAQTTNGTIIAVQVPAANGGAGRIRIYTLAGELVRDLAVSFTADSYNYVEWDGRNKGGEEVANGVYYGVVELNGKKAGDDTTFKMAVVK